MKSNNGESKANFVDFLVTVTIVISWLMGIVLAKGAWATFVSIVFPPYTWYLTTKYLMSATGA